MKYVREINREKEREKKKNEREREREAVNIWMRWMKQMVRKV